MGALVGGIGGRIAMFALRLTSDASLHGAETDDGFIIGQISSSTLFLIIVTGVLGVIGGVFYLAVRSWLPVPWRASSFGMFGGIVGGAGVIHPGGTDFTLLDPLPLAIAMFIALPAIYGVVVSRVIERWLRRDAGPGDSPVWIVGLIPIVPWGSSDRRGSPCRSGCWHSGSRIARRRGSRPSGDRGRSCGWGERACSR